jgi:hypothetical protein
MKLGVQKECEYANKMLTDCCKSEVRLAEVLMLRMADTFHKIGVDRYTHTQRNPSMQSLRFQNY